MNAQEAMKISQGYGYQIQVLVKVFEAGDIPETLYDNYFEQLLQRGLFMQEFGKRLSMTECRIDMEAREQYQDYLEAKYEYRDWLCENDCTAIVPTYWHGRAMASRPGLPTYHSRLGRVTIPENES